MPKFVRLYQYTVHLAIEADAETEKEARKATLHTFNILPSYVPSLNGYPAKATATDPELLGIFRKETETHER